MNDIALSPFVGSGFRSPWNCWKAASESALSDRTLTDLPAVVRPGSGLFFCRPRSRSSSVSLSSSAPASRSLSAASLSGTGGFGSFSMRLPSGDSRGSLAVRLWPEGAGLACLLLGLRGSFGPRSPGSADGAGDLGLRGSFSPRSPGNLIFGPPYTEDMAPVGLRLSGIGLPSLSCLGRAE